jgi:hypothetical protein
MGTHHLKTTPKTRVFIEDIGRYIQPIIFINASSMLKKNHKQVNNNRSHESLTTTIARDDLFSVLAAGYADTRRLAVLPRSGTPGSLLCA